MARARNIKPGFFSNDELVELSFSTRLLFIGLWTLADRAGRMEDRPKKIKMALFPADNLDVDAGLQELHDSGFLQRYEAQGTLYIQVLAFEKHQNPHRDEKASLIPPPCESHTSTVAAQCSHGGNRADSPIPDSLNLNPDSPIPDLLGNPIVAGKPSTTGPKAEVEVFEYWQQVMGHKATKLDAKRSKAIKARLAEGYTVSDLCRAVDGCKYDPFSQGANDRQTVYDELALICRDAPKVDSFLKIAERGPPSTRAPNAQRTIDNLNAYLDRKT